MRRLTTLALFGLVCCALLAMPAGASARAAIGSSDAGVNQTAAPMIRITPPGAGALLGVNANVQTSNWSGYASATSLTSPANNAVSDVTGSWVVPTVSGGATNGYCADWIGIDGYSSSSVEQLGTSENWIGGAPQYYAWWEMYPGASHSITMTIHPGDVMSAEVKWASGNTFTLSMTDQTTGVSFSTQQNLGSTAARNSAEWIHEAPSSGSVLQLAQTTPVTFTGCNTTIGGTNGPISGASWQNTGIDMVQNSTVVAQASGLSAGGTSFVVGAPGTLPHISPSSNSLTFNYTVGGSTPAAQPITITNTAGGVLSWSAASDSPAWLSCSPASGGSGAFTSVSVTPASLAAGTYHGNIVLAATGADNTPLSVPVTLVVSPPPDTTAPTTTLIATPTPNGAGWDHANVALGLHATDNAGGSGVAATYYTLDAVQHSYTTTVTLSTEGVHALTYWSVDASGNAETPKAATVRLDKTAPALTLDATATYVSAATIDATATDALSGLDHVDMRLDGGSFVTVTQLTTSVLGAHTVYARAFDLAGNERDVSAAFTVVSPPPPPLPAQITVGTTTKLAGPSKSKLKRKLTLTGIVLPATVTGQVTVTRTRLVGKKWRSAGSANVSVVNGKFSYSFKPGYRGKWRFVARYSGGVVTSTTYLSSKSLVRTVQVK
ncbi:MAG: G1 family endopeptidase [Coriobacteriia bacterium]|nr:G1 family endopeptidase [Coriobacteriia bacterium]